MLYSNVKGSYISVYIGIDVDSEKMDSTILSYDRSRLGTPSSKVFSDQFIPGIAVNSQEDLSELGLVRVRWGASMSEKRRRSSLLQDLVSKRAAEDEAQVIS